MQITVTTALEHHADATAELDDADVSLLRDGLVALALRGRLGDVRTFARNHPEFDLLIEAEEPALEEDR